MCFRCDDEYEYEKPTEYCLSVVPLIKDAIDAGEKWGALHIVLEDGNMDSVEWCLTDQNPNEWTEQGLVCAKAMLPLSIHQRETALMLADTDRGTRDQVVKWVDKKE